MPSVAYNLSSMSQVLCGEYHSYQPGVTRETETLVKQYEIDIFLQPARIIIAGASNSGKSVLSDRLINRYKSRFDVLILCGKNEPVSGVPAACNLSPKVIASPSIIDPFEYAYQGNTILYVLDDLFMESGNSPIVSNVFTRGRHSNISVIFITQNIFYGGKFTRNISLNATHFFILKSRDLSQIETLGRQIAGKSHGKTVVEVYRRALRENAFGYLLIDTTVKRSILQFRTNVFNEDGKREIIYDIE